MTLTPDPETIAPTPQPLPHEEGGEQNAPSAEDAPFAAPNLPPDAVLGAAIQHHPSDRLRPLIVAGIIGAPIAAGAVLVIALSPPDALWVALLASIVTGAAGIALGWYVLHLWNREVILYERGFSYREGSKVVPFLYQEIAAIRTRAERRAYFGGLLRRDAYQYTLTTTADETIVIGDLYRRAAALGNTLTARAMPAIRSRAEAALNAGKRVRFHESLTMSAAGLHADGRDLAWAALSGWRVGNRQLVLMAKRRAPDGSSLEPEAWHALPLAAIDNLPLLLALMNRPH